ncbi:MAG TPA: HypC/HybG/HupF family hydrogenase formation chaperone [bacterium]|nr:HypC/HybG/HupF family hydrogenase formation chaperone [bacterium]HPQ18687.1 HypC/HybG/HupF family hydrogenase formation chaperone [bacterium]
MKIKKIKSNDIAIAELNDVEREVCISLLEDVKINDYILVHAGFGIERIEPDEAKKTLELLNEMYSFKSAK